MAARYLVPALAVAGRAAAQCSASATTTIQNQGDASGLAGCSTFSGSIAIATNAAGNIALDGIQTITGSLYSSNATGLNSLSGDSLEEIQDTFHLDSMTVLSGLSFPRLSTVDTITWDALAALQSLTFTSGVQMASSVSITNTQLYSLEGIDLETVDTLIIANNPYLNSVSMQLGNVTTQLTLQANGRNVTAVFPNLIWGNVIEFHNVSSVSIPSLASTNSSLGFYSNFFSTLAAPNLTTVGGDLSFNDNQALTDISMPELTTVGGGLDIGDNTALDTIDDFGSLQTVGGALDVNGNFSTIELPDLADVKGAFNLQSSKDISDACNHFQPLSGMNNVIKGKYTCLTTSTPHGENSTGTGTSGSSSSTSSSPANAVVITGATGLLGVVAAIFGML